MGASTPAPITLSSATSPELAEQLMKSQTLKAQKQLSLAKKFKYATTLTQFPPSLGMSDTLQQKTILQA
jgi:hypothetical protein